MMIEVITFKIPDDMTHENLFENYDENYTHHLQLYLLEMMSTEQTYLSNRKIQ